MNISGRIISSPADSIDSGPHRLSDGHVRPLSNEIPRSKRTEVSMGNLGHFSVVTDDVLLHAFSFLPGRCLAKCGATSRAFLGLADRDALWRDLCTCSLDALLSEGTVAPVGRYTWLPQIAAS
eukprot:CAMPEP_0172633548 /NCGR_PEP_ID=MMETSP1068-20121228/189967_1 /TAXON_ID=35684 /ORGANISM="Pseudopedinella elastica, Strain CCMP716" /LENGTH=122 /DNA_ID=CAMNT_0013445265 /DNA_START=119 /DNA_END=484 /DNA_ORIENTATION=-